LVAEALLGRIEVGKDEEKLRPVSLLTSSSRVVSE
jgi:hypothetical protein